VNKFYFLIFIAIIAVFGIIIYSTQKETGGRSGLSMPNLSPTLAPEGSELDFFSNNSLDKNPLAQSQKQQAGQQQATQQQQQQQAQQQTELQGPVNASVSATIKTSKGDIEVILFGKEAQKTVINFITKAKGRYYNNLTFHRVEDWVVQGGDPAGNGTGGGAIQTELNAKPFLTGSLGMAASTQMQVGQGARISNDSQFFITKNDSEWLDGQYTNFGMVTRGMDVVHKIKIGDKITGITIN
jgi:peptidyl-prolyl cis-trans isomerase B (cyclophilin B)